MLDDETCQGVGIINVTCDGILSACISLPEAKPEYQDLWLSRTRQDPNKVEQKKSWLEKLLSGKKLLKNRANRLSTHKRPETVNVPTRADL